jgi:hypothetical protein
MEREGGSGPKPDEIDGQLAAARQQIIIQMVNDGKLDPEQGAELFESSTDPGQVARDRAAAESGDSGPGTPGGQLSILFSKLKPGSRQEP